MTITTNQISYIAHLIRDAGFVSEISAVDAYGLGLRPVRDLSRSEASELIEWLKAGAQTPAGTVEIAVGTPFASPAGTGTVITQFSDGRFFVKFSNGTTGYVEASEIKIG